MSKYGSLFHMGEQNNLLDDSEGIPMSHIHHTCPHCGNTIAPDATVPSQPVKRAPWVWAFGEDYFDSLPRKAELLNALAQWEDVSYSNDMMPSFILQTFQVQGDDEERQTLCVKLWCGFHDGNGDFISNVFLADEDEAWLGDLGSVCDVMTLLNGEQPIDHSPSNDELIDGLLSLSKTTLTREQEVLLCRPLSSVLSVK